MGKEELNLMIRIKKYQEGFSKGQKKIADYILNHYEKAAYMTAAILGKTIGISESTIVRFATQLEYEGYPEFQEALQDMIKTKLTTTQRVELSYNRISPQEVLKTILTSDIDKIKETLEQINQQEFNTIIDKICNAKKIYILGVRNASILANFLGFNLNYVFDNIKVMSAVGLSEMYEQLVRIDKDDIVIGISFPRYSKRTVKALEFVKQHGAMTIAITDSKISPLISYSDYSLIARSDMASFADSLVAPLSLINAIIVAVSLKKKDEILNVFAKIDNIEKTQDDDEDEFES